jgi:hypothetical protein
MSLIKSPESIPAVINPEESEKLDPINPHPEESKIRNKLIQTAVSDLRLLFKLDHANLFKALDNLYHQTINDKNLTKEEIKSTRVDINEENYSEDIDTYIQHQLNLIATFNSSADNFTDQEKQDLLVGNYRLIPAQNKPDKLDSENDPNTLICTFFDRNLSERKFTVTYNPQKKEIYSLNVVSSWSHIE